MQSLIFELKVKSLTKRMGIPNRVAHPKSRNYVMMTQLSPRYLIGFGTEIVHCPDTLSISVLFIRCLQLFCSCLQVDPCWLISMQGFGRNGPRSKSGRVSFPFLHGRLTHFLIGCSTCRRRKVKCGEEKPVCARCSSLRLNCEWGVPVKRGRSTQIRHLEPAPETSEQPSWPTAKAEDLVGFQPDALFASPSPVSWASDALPFDTFNPVPIPTPICPSLNVNVACANSLTLTSLDRQYFQYFPSSSLVFYYMKRWKWNSLW